MQSENSPRQMCVIVMMSSHSPSMCLEFEGGKHKDDKLATERIRQTILWASEQDGVQLLFLASADPWEADLGQALKGLANHIMLPLLPAGEQRRLGIPFSSEQIVVAESLTRLEECAIHIANRPMIVHVGAAELPDLARVLLRHEESIRLLQIYPRNVDQFTARDVGLYERQLEQLSTQSLMRCSAGLEAEFCITNFRLLRPVRSDATHCSAGRAFRILGPDGAWYACPAFYRSGIEPAPGALDASAEADASAVPSENTCPLCGSGECFQCAYLESLPVPARTQYCEIAKVERKLNASLIRRCAQSPYLFDCLRTLASNEAVMRSRGEGNLAGLGAYERSGITLPDLVEALQTVAHHARRILGEDDVAGREDDEGRWREDRDETAASQRDIFYRRLRETHALIDQLSRSPSS